ncbi:MAG: hypothetical protein KatS3mg129_0795 [Leptospiraceae bacterium]|nr:MAG: hypothetical protein KatS3mg129_0795 [Leptospiraceae bacterium]
MKVSNKEFEKQLLKYLQFKGIDISIQLADGKIIHLNKNRSFDKGYIINYTKKGVEEKIPIKSVTKAEFYIA